MHETRDGSRPPGGFEIGYTAHDGAQHRVPLADAAVVRFADMQPTGAETVQRSAERVGERSHPDRDAGGTGGHGDGGQRSFQHGRVRWRQRAPVAGSYGRAEQFGRVKVEDLAQSFEEPQGHVVVIGVGLRVAPLRLRPLPSRHVPGLGPQTAG
jgi:hypothetical protein